MQPEWISIKDGYFAAITPFTETEPGLYNLAWVASIGSGDDVSSVRASILLKVTAYDECTVQSFGLDEARSPSMIQGQRVVDYVIG